MLVPVRFLTCTLRLVRWDVADQDKPAVHHIRTQAGHRIPKKDLARPVLHIRE